MHPRKISPAHAPRPSATLSPRATARDRAALLATLLAALLPAFASAQTTVSGTIAAAGGAALLDGDRPAYQQRLRQKKDGYHGLEDFTIARTTDATLFRFEGKFIQGNDDYRLAARWEKFDGFYLAADYRGFRTFYDGSGGRLLPQDLAISWFDEALALDRSYLTVEFGTLSSDLPQFRLRYERTTREGTKNSIRWADSNLAGAPFSPRAFIPSYYLVDENREAFIAEASQQTDAHNWKVSGRHERTSVGNRHYARRRAFEPAADRYETTREGYDQDLFSGHAFYERFFHEKLRASAGGLVTKLDTNLTGARIYGATPDAEFSSTSARRQTGDVGYYGLTGGARLKQYLGNLNVVYQPTQHWTIRPGVKYEHLRQDAGDGFFDTAVGGGAAAPTFVQQIEAASRNSWNEFTEELEFRYTRWAHLALDVRAQWNQGTGNLVERSVLLPASVSVLDRETEYERLGQRYIVNASWYPRPGLTLAAHYNYRVKIGDFEHRRDSTNNAAGGDRYPAFIIDQDLEAHEGNVRLSWRPKPMLSFVTRYGYQLATVTSSFDRLPEIESGELTRHVVTQTATWNPHARLFLTGAVSVVSDRLVVPPNRFTVNADNDYVSAALGAGYAAGKLDDLYLDLNHYRADNYADNPQFTLPLDAGQTTQSAFLTWVRRASDRLIYTARYGYAINRDGTYGGQNDFDAHIFYAKVQYKF